MKPGKLFESGKYFVGVNYWASHAGMFMWRNWNEEVVDHDLKLLSESGLQVLRVFPLWPDFQPLRVHLTGGKTNSEYRFGEDPLPFTEAGQCGVDEVMADRFEILCDIAEKYGLKLVVGLITGWMSGRVFLPEPFSSLEPLKDHSVMKWETRFVRYMVRRFKDHPAIGAWDLGNECNCLGDANHDDAFIWASLITNTVRSEDRSHPVVSGMHGLRPEGSHPWSASDQGEILDILCTHPYPMFTPYCNIDPLNTMRSVIHATAESVYFSSLGGKPCFVEEGGTLGPMISSDEMAGKYLRASLFSTWAHDLRGFCWWCAFDQDELTNTPYDWDPVERELGLFTFNRTKKPVVDEFSKFRKFIDEYPYEKLPDRLLDATVVITSGQDQWAAAFGSFILAKQAGLDVDFVWCKDEIPESPAYIMPSVSSNHAISKRAMDTILERVYNGATLYISLSNGILSHFREITGLYLKSRNQSPVENGGVEVKIDGETLRLNPPYRHVLESVGADVLAADQTGNPFFSVNKYGQGKIYFCNAPVEIISATSGGSLEENGQVPFFVKHHVFKIYELLGIKNPSKVTAKTSPVIGITEHPISENKRIINIINQSPDPIEENISVSDGFTFREFYSPSSGINVRSCDCGIKVTIPGDTGVSVLIEK